MKNGKFPIPGKKALLKGFEYPEIVVMDVTETAIERPKRRQKKYYSGNKKLHTLKSQLVINQETREIIYVAFGPRHSHDFSLFKKSKTHFHTQTDSLQEALHNSSVLSIASPQGTNIFQLVIGTVLCFK
jgi:hypothetical protein